MEFRRAIIDLGTNTFHLLIAANRMGKTEILSRIQVPVKLGEDGINKGVIAPRAYQRGMDALLLFHHAILEYAVGEVKAFGTSAIRDATNGNLFIEEAFRRFQIQIEAIDGNKEAEYIYQGVIHSITLPEQPVLVMDIGGGSVECIIGLKHHILWKQSFPIGAARLLQRFHQHEPISEDEVRQIEAYLAEVLYPVIQQANRYQPEMLIGAAGAFETMSDVLHKDLDYLSEALGPFACMFKPEDFTAFHRLMLHADTGQRKALKGMLDFRVDMIVVSSMLINHMLSRIPFKQLVVSAFSLKEGILYAGLD